MERFYEKINDPNYNAATFFAVCRGKVGVNHLCMKKWLNSLIHVAALPAIEE